MQARRTNSPVQRDLQFQSSKRRRTEAVNRATGVSFLLEPAQPRRAASWLLIIEDCFFPPWGSVVLPGLSFLSAFYSVSLLSFTFAQKKYRNSPTSPALEHHPSPV